APPRQAFPTLEERGPCRVPQAPSAIAMPAPGGSRGSRPPRRANPRGARASPRSARAALRASPWEARRTRHHGSTGDESERHPLDAAAGVANERDHLLDEERVSLRGLEDTRPQNVVQIRKALDQECGLLAAEGL